MKKILTLSLATSLLLSPIANANMDKYFTDLEVDNPQYNHIQWLARSGIVKGYEDGSFRSGECVNRAEFLKMLYLTTQAELEASVTNPFPDVNEDAWYAKYVLSAYADGVISGYADGTFKPNRCVSKPEVLKMASEAYYSDEEINVGLQVGGFPISVDNDDWFFKYYNFAFPKNLAVYDAEFTINQPIGTQGATRGDVAETLWRFQALQDSDAFFFDTSVSAPREIFQEYMGVDEMLTFYFPVDWEVAEDYFYETAGGATSEMATITLEHRMSMDIISINERQVQCDGEFSATCLETDLGYTISSFDPSPSTFKTMQKIQSTLTYESPEFVN